MVFAEIIVQLLGDIAKDLEEYSYYPEGESDAAKGMIVIPCSVLQDICVKRGGEYIQLFKTTSKQSNNVGRSPIKLGVLKQKKNNE